VGGGIVWESVDRDEYTECQLKARVLTDGRPEFSLLETMLWTPEEGYFILPYHLQRLQDSAIYFNYPAEIERTQAELDRLAASLPAQPHRVRLLVAQDGSLTCQALPLDIAPDGRPVRLRLAPTPIDLADPFLYHKTTHRQLYEAARAACPDADEVLLWNERGEVTETTIANVIIRLDNEWVTPPVTCGLLPGTFRAWLLAQGQVRERVVKLDELKQSEQIYLVNSVRKWRKADLIR
jgi:para-aminobenzoate synthetase/4-amino-4-deoxychorismate lyase